MDITELLAFSVKHNASDLQGKCARIRSQRGAWFNLRHHE